MMDSETKLYLGRLFGEVFRMQKRLDPDMVQVSDANIYGLLNGMETAFDNVFRDFNPITDAEYTAVEDVLDAADRSGKTVDYWNDLEPALGRGRDGKMPIVYICRFIYNDNRFHSVISDMRKPAELHRIELQEDDI
ncbi:MAG: hypothetical protein H6733_07870 [Alphaproteobacteria bacterium]|nr:hypothetical protein [Alphaproteobacteria bacterium]